MNGEPQPCAWPACLSDEQAEALCDSILAGSLGEPDPNAGGPPLVCERYASECNPQA